MNFRDFRRKLATDRAFAKQFDDCQTPEALIEAAAREGYQFTAEDIKNDTELLPEEVALAAGGIAPERYGVSVSKAFANTPKIMNGK